ncbi:MAG: ABA4-like family protein [Trueperaceae bacterium]
MIENLFALINLLPLPFWVAMLLFPRTSLTQRMVTSSWPFIILAGLYTILLLAAFASLSPSEFGISAIAIQAAIAGGWGFLAVWAHLLTLDLFAGIWIFRDARYWSVQPAPYLLATLFTGPLGLGLYLYQRQRREKRDPIRNLN